MVIHGLSERALVVFCINNVSSFVLAGSESSKPAGVATSRSSEGCGRCRTSEAARSRADF